MSEQNIRKRGPEMCMILYLKLSLLILLFLQSPNKDFSFFLEDRVSNTGDARFFLLNSDNGELILTKTVLNTVITNPTDVLQVGWR